MFRWFEKRRIYYLAKHGNIGGTADFLCTGYLSSVNSITLKDKWKGLVNPPDSQEKRTEELNNLFDFMITARFQFLPDEFIENKIRQQELTKFGAFSFIASILKVEEGFHLHKEEWMIIFFEVMAERLQKNLIPNWVARGDSFDNWDPIEVIKFFQEPPI